jgi:hypothetical protein
MIRTLKYMILHSFVSLLPFYCVAQTIQPAPMVINSIPTNQPFDGQMIRYLAKYTNPLLIRGVKNSLQPAGWNDPKLYLDSTILSKIKQLNPNVTTAFYTMLECRVVANDTSFDWETMHGMDSLGIPSLIADPKNNSTYMLANGRLIYGDPRNQYFRNWIIGRIDTTFHQKMICDGFQLDRTWIDPVSQFFSAAYKRDTNMIKTYSDSNYTLMQQIRQNFPDAYIQVNGISPETCIDQSRFLDFADAQNIEAFGITESDDSIFQTAVLPYIKLIDSTAFINKRFNCFGSGHGNYKNAAKYRSYADEKKWERYLFGCFLLGTNGKSGFHFRTGSAYPMQDTGRFCGLDLHSDYIYNRLGNAVGHFYADTSGLYLRTFQNGFVIVAPVTEVSKTYTYNLSNDMYDNEGNLYSGTVNLRSGEAFILYNFKQEPLPCMYEINFEDSITSGNYIANGLKYLPNATIKKERNNHYVSFTALKSNLAPFEHDIMLDWVRYQIKDSLFTFRYKTKTPNVSIQLFCEVDDTLKHEYYNAVIDFIVPEKNSKKYDSGYAYRTMTFAQNQPVKIPARISSQKIINDGNWHTIEINGNELLSAGVKFIRPHFMRVKGKINLDDIIVYHKSCNESVPIAKN